jgi:hypothetical protein
MHLSDEKKSEAAVSLQHSANGLSSITALFPSESLRQETLRRQHCTRLTVFSKQLGQRLVFPTPLRHYFRQTLRLETLRRPALPHSQLQHYLTSSAPIRRSPIPLTTYILIAQSSLDRTSHLITDHTMSLS